MQIILWILTAVAAYRLWGEYTWLSIIVILLALSYEVHPQDQAEHTATGMYSKGTGTRLMFTALGIAAIFIYSLLA